MALEGTIFALASGAGRSALAVVRISGPEAATMVGRLCGALPPARRASLRALRHQGVLLDRGIVLWMPGPASYTGEDTAELHLHGGTAVQDGVVDALLAVGARPAEAGEFTKRALLNGRLDVTEAEAIADLVAAETRAQRDQALRQLGGELGALYREWADRLRRVMARQEALIDFPDEELPPEVEAMIAAEIEALRGAIARHLADGGRGEKVRDGLVFAIAGPPNVGKSSLLNALSGREVAITAPTPGTTRDAVEARMVLAEVPVTLVDTAGLRQADDPVEAEGVRRALDRVATADLVVLVSAPGLAARVPDAVGQVLDVFNKADLADAGRGSGLVVSARTGQGMDALRSALAEIARRRTSGYGSPVLTRARHRAALTQALERLEGAKWATWPELRAEDLRLALRALGRVTGAVDVEKVLDSLFAEFCIGK